MAYDRYRQAVPVDLTKETGTIYAKKGIMIVGGGSADVKLFKPAIFTTGVTAGMGAGDHTQAADEQTTVFGTAQGSVFPAGVHTVVRVDAGTTVFKLA